MVGEQPLVSKCDLAIQRVDRVARISQCEAYPPGQNSEEATSYSLYSLGSPRAVVLTHPNRFYQGKLGMISPLHRKTFIAFFYLKEFFSSFSFVFLCAASTTTAFVI
jgi:hypothetical protein